MLSATVIGEGPRLKLARIAATMAHSVLDAKKRYASAVLSDLIEQTPKLSGQATANWQVSLGEASDVFIELREAIKSKTYDASSVGDALSHGLSVIASIEQNQTIFIANNAPYIVRLNEGYSPKAPAGFVDAILRNNLETLHRRGIVA